MNTPTIGERFAAFCADRPDARCPTVWDTQDGEILVTSNGVSAVYVMRRDAPDAVLHSDPLERREFFPWLYGVKDHSTACTVGDVRAALAAGVTPAHTCAKCRYCEGTRGKECHACDRWEDCSACAGTGVRGRRQCAGCKATTNPPSTSWHGIALEAALVLRALDAVGADDSAAALTGVCIIGTMACTRPAAFVHGSCWGITVMPHMHLGHNYVATWPQPMLAAPGGPLAATAADCGSPGRSVEVASSDVTEAA